MFTNFQIITNIPLMNLQYPDNVYILFGFIYDIANYQVYPMGSLYEEVFPGCLESSDTMVVNSNFEIFGFNESFL